MISRAQKIRLGIFVFVALALLVGMIIVLIGSKLSDIRDVYTARFQETVSGLEVGAPVKYHGVRVGTVQSIEIDRKNISDVIVAVSLKAKTPIKEDTRIVLNTMGITGLMFLELSGGTNDARFLNPGEEIQTGESLISKLTGKADVISEKVEILVNNLVSLTGESQRQRIDEILASLQETSNTLAGIVAGNEKKLNEAVKDLSESISRVSELSKGLEGRLDRLQDDVGSAVQGFNDLGSRLELVVDDQNENITMLLMDLDSVVLSVLELLDDESTRRIPGELLATIRAGRQFIKGTGEQTTRLMGHLDKDARLVGNRLEDGRLDTAMDRLVNLSGTLEGFVQTLDLTMRQSRDDIFKALGSFKDVVRNLNDFTQMLLENPSILLRGSQLKERNL